MNQSIISASVAMSSLQRKMDVISDNVANLDTHGYKRKTASFADVLTNVTNQLPEFQLPGRATPLGYTNGYGSRISSITRDFSQGEPVVTNIPTDLALIGNGLFEVATPEGPAYVREGDFQMSPLEGGASLLTNRDGYPIVSTDGGTIEIQQGYQMKIDTAGVVYEVDPATSEAIEVGVIRTVQPIKPELLQQLANNLYVIPPGVDANAVLQQLDLTNVAVDGNVPLTVRQGALENSNVSMIDEMTDLIQAQRAYQMASRALASGDAMSGLANSIRG